MNGPGGSTKERDKDAAQCLQMVATWVAPKVGTATDIAITFFGFGISDMV